MQRQYGTMRAVRHAASVIALVELAGIAINVVIYPFTGIFAQYEAGSTPYELANLLIYLLLYGLPLLPAVWLTGFQPRELFGTARPPRDVYIMTICLTMGWEYVSIWLDYGLMEFMAQFGIAESGSSYDMAQSPTALLVQFVSLAIVPPLIEEFSFRGLFLQNARRAMGTWSAIALTAITFWMGHHSVTILPMALGFGIIGGYVRERYGSLMPSILAHCVVNSLYLVLNVGSNVLSETGMGILDSTVTLMELVLGVIGVTMFVRMGCLRELQAHFFGEPDELTPMQTVRAVLTSAPVILLLLTFLYFTASNLEVMAA